LRKFFLGALLGIFLCVSFFELFCHLEVERIYADHSDCDYCASPASVCGDVCHNLLLYWSPEMVEGVKAVYKIFAFPVKTTYFKWRELSE